MENTNVHRCESCNKIYSSYKSLWNHNKKFHKNNVNKKIHIINPSPDNCQQKNPYYGCQFCKKVFTSRQSKSRHENFFCHIKEKVINEKKYENLYMETQKENKEIKEQLTELKNLLQKAIKIHPKTLTKINNQLNNSGTINNINIIQLGKENLDELMTEKEKIAILNNNANCINELIKKVHISDDNRYKQFIGLVRKK